MTTPQAGAETQGPHRNDHRSPRKELVGGVLFCAGTVLCLAIMSQKSQSPSHILYGGFGSVVASIGVLFGLNGFGRTQAPAARVVSLSPLLRQLLHASLAAGALTLNLRLAVSGSLRSYAWAAGPLLTLNFLWLVVAGFHVMRTLGVFSDDKPGLLKRYGLWLCVVHTLLHLPALGSFSLIDPWETHYGEVAREMLARDDWISLWWAQDGWFWSKPILDFWIQGLSFALLGVPYQPDQMLGGIAIGLSPQPEWAARFPIFILTLLGLYALYKAVAAVFGRRAGLLSGLVLTTIPYWFFLGRQTMTDMPYTAPLCAAFAALWMGAVTDPSVEVKDCAVCIGRFRYRLNAFHWLFGALLLMVLPQCFYLASRNLVFDPSLDSFALRLAADSFLYGSGGGNCGLPGNPGCRSYSPVNANVQPVHTAIAALAVVVYFIYSYRRERRAQRLWFVAAWFFTTLSAMAKGAPGLVLPLCVAFAFVVVTRRWALLSQMEFGALALMVACLLLPWYVQMFMRHGQPFIDRLLFHDMYKRAFEHVHDTNTGEDVSFRYYIWQLGYGLFPWSGLAAAAWVAWLKDEPGTGARYQVNAVLALWLMAGFGMFTISLTKFHHYVLPIVPAAAVLTGIFLDDVWRHSRGGTSPVVRPAWRNHCLWCVPSTLLLVGGFLLTFGGSAFGSVGADGQPPSPSYSLGVSLLVAAGLVATTYAVLSRKRRANSRPTRQSTYSTWLGVMGFLGVCLTVLIVRDLSLSPPDDVTGPARLVHLFCYKYDRAWPRSLAFEGVVAAFGAVTCVSGALFIAHRLRRAALVCYFTIALFWALWAIDVYLIEIAPHWGQRETIAAYYKHRSGPGQLLVAYQMNWKGENFYTGNRVATFVSSGQAFKDWIEKQKTKGVRSLYFTTEHSRIPSLKKELGSVRSFDQLTTKRLNNKFMLAKVTF